MRLARPIGENRVANEFVDGSACIMDDISRVAKPLSQRARKFILRQDLRHRREAAYVADHYRDDSVLIVRGVSSRRDGHIVSRVLGRLFGLLENELVVGDSNHGPIVKNRGSDDAAAVHKGAVAAAKIHDLELVGIVATDHRVLARDVRVAVQADRVVAAPPDRGRIADFDLKRLSFRGTHF